MKVSAVVTAVVALALAIAVGIVVHLRGGKPSQLDPPAPAKKWEFTIAKSLVQDCSKHPCSPGPDLPEHTPAIDSDGTIYVGTAHGLSALNPDGSVKWSNENSVQVQYSPVLHTLIDDKDNIWFDYKTTMPTGGLYRISADGRGDAVMGGEYAVWQVSLAYDGSIFIVKQNGTAVMGPDGALEPTVGNAPGMTNIPHVVVGIEDSKEPPAMKWNASGQGFVFARDGHFYQLLASSGPFGMGGDFIESVSPDRTVEWAYEATSKGSCAYPAMGTDGVIYAGCNENVVAVKADGTLKWSFPLAGHRAGQPAIAEDGTVYFGCNDANVYALDSEGKLKWRFATGGSVFSTPAIAKNGTIFFGSYDHNLYAVGADGKLKWEFKTGGQVFSPTIGPDGTIYALSLEGKLYAIQDLEPNGGLWGQWPKFASDLRNTARGAAPN